MPWVTGTFKIRNKQTSLTAKESCVMGSFKIQFVWSISFVYWWTFPLRIWNCPNELSKQYHTEIQHDIMTERVMQSGCQAVGLKGSSPSHTHTHTAQLRACLCHDAGLGSICHTSVALPRPCLSVCVSLCHLWGLDCTKSGWAVRVDEL